MDTPATIKITIKSLTLYTSVLFLSAVSSSIHSSLYVYTMIWPEVRIYRGNFWLVYETGFSQCVTMVVQRMNDYSEMRFS